MTDALIAALAFIVLLGASYGLAIALEEWLGGND